MSEIDKIPIKHFRNLFLHEKECNCEKEIDLILEPLEQLKPLEDLYRKENPREDGKFYIPDATTFYKWITNKILQNENIKREN